MLSAWNSKYDIKKWYSANSHKPQTNVKLKAFFCHQVCWFEAWGGWQLLVNIKPFPDSPTTHSPLLCLPLHCTAQCLVNYFCSTCHSKDATLMSSTDRKWDRTRKRKNCLRQNGPDGWVINYYMYVLARAPAFTFRCQLLSALEYLHLAFSVKLWQFVARKQQISFVTQPARQTCVKSTNFHISSCTRH